MQTFQPPRQRDPGTFPAWPLLGAAWAAQHAASPGRNKSCCPIAHGHFSVGVDEHERHTVGSRQRGHDPARLRTSPFPPAAIRHAVTAIEQDHRLGINRLVERRPTAVAVELGARDEQLGAASLPVPQCAAGGSVAAAGLFRLCAGVAGGGGKVVGPVRSCEERVGRQSFQSVFRPRRVRVSTFSPVLSQNTAIDLLRSW